jgi:hypothetical protein
MVAYLWRMYSNVLIYRSRLKNIRLYEFHKTISPISLNAEAGDLVI